MATNPLDAIEIPVPCKASWEGMKGDDRVRHCDLCRLNVYNLSGMARKEAEALLTGSKGRVCVRLYRRPDGTVLTRNCRIFVNLRRATAAALIAAATGVTGFFAWASGSAGVGLWKGGIPGVKRMEPFRSISRWVEDRLGLTPPRVPVIPSAMGRIYLPAIMGEAVAPAPTPPAPAPDPR